MRLTPGSQPPDLAATDFLGQPVSLVALRGAPVLLSFYRYASCPVCNFRMRAIIQHYPEWSGQGLHVVSVFQSPVESIRQYVGRQDAPFPIVADPDLTHYRRFGVEARWRGLFSLGVAITALKAFRSGFLPGRVDGPFERTPADFLIAPDGRIALAHYGANIDDHIPIATITQWLKAPQN
ncbi:MAG: AhpC/TSA family protein [Ramlibacter sp.]|nr:AhpC/TSA family protein [Ramlibacter sp.]